MQKPSRLAPFVSSGLAVAIGATLTSLLAADLATPPAARALLLYSAEGSAIDGSLGGPAFTNAEWKISAVADETLSTNLVFNPGPGIFDLWLLPVTPRAVIRYGSGQTLEAELLPKRAGQILDRGPRTDAPAWLAGRPGLESPPAASHRRRPAGSGGLGRSGNGVNRPGPPLRQRFSHR